MNSAERTAISRFCGKIVIVTGAAGDIGRAAAVRFASEGAAIVAVDLEDLAETVAAVEAAGGKALPVRADVTRSADVATYVQRAIDTFGGVDVLFNNAGIEGDVSPLEDYPEAMFDRVLDVNVKGVWLGMRHVAAAMRARGGGAIINSSSRAGLVGTPEPDRLRRGEARSHRHDQDRGHRAGTGRHPGERRLPWTHRYPHDGGDRGRQEPRGPAHVPESER